MMYKDKKARAEDLVQKGEHDLAVQVYCNAFAQGHSEAMYDLGCLYNRHIWGLTLTEQREGNAISCFIRSADKGYAPAQYEAGRYHIYGTVYSYPQLPERDYKQGFEYFKQAADGGHSSAQYETGLCYYYKKGVEKNPSSAYSYFEKAAKQGHPRAIQVLAAIAENSEHSKDFEDTSRIEAQITLGELNEQGTKIKKNYEKALYWYGKAAEQNSDEGKMGIKRIRLNQVIEHFRELINSLYAQKNEKDFDILKKNWSDFKQHLQGTLENSGTLAYFLKDISPTYTLLNELLNGGTPIETLGQEYISNIIQELESDIIKLDARYKSPETKFVEEFPDDEQPAEPQAVSLSETEDSEWLEVNTLPVVQKTAGAAAPRPVMAAQAGPTLTTQENSDNLGSMMKQFKNFIFGESPSSAPKPPIVPDYRPTDL